MRVGSGNSILVELNRVENLGKMYVTANTPTSTVIPITIDGIPSEVLNPRESWDNKSIYDSKAKELSDLFKENFKKYGVSIEYLKEFGPK